MVVAVGGPARGLARGALEESRREAARRERARRGLGDPLARELAARRERERERPVGDAEADRQLGHERHARANPGAAEPLAPPRAMRRAIATKVSASAARSAREDATTELALLGAERERRGELVERRPRGGGREPVEVVHEPRLERGPDPREERLRVQPLERPRPVLGRRPRERRHATDATTRAARRPVQLVELEEAVA